jgi:hypothetical protein
LRGAPAAFGAGARSGIDEGTNGLLAAKPLKNKAKAMGWKIEPEALIVSSESAVVMHQMELTMVHVDIDTLQYDAIQFAW